MRIKVSPAGACRALAPAAVIRGGPLLTVETSYFLAGKEQESAGISLSGSA